MLPAPKAAAGEGRTKSSTQVTRISDPKFKAGSAISKAGRLIDLFRIKKCLVLAWWDDGGVKPKSHVEAAMRMNLKGL